jgi:3,4-dihydroxy 2-butanone 4-phosphate synthase / GTP cyclohydrolase II
VPLRMIEEAGAGILLYVFPRGRASLVADFKPFVSASSSGSGAAEPSPARANAPLTDIGLGAQVLAHLGARTVRLLTNHPRRIVGLGGYGLEVTECVPIRPPQKVMALRDTDGGKRSKSST